MRIPELMLVYRLFDVAGRLLYVGISQRDRLPRRLAEHRRTKTWWPDVAPNATTTVDCLGREVAHIMEQEAILTEHPIHNRADTTIRAAVRAAAAGGPNVPPENAERARRLLAVVAASSS